MNRQSNTYTIIYSIILVVVVGVMLSVVYQALHPQQLENIANDTKRQILAAALITPKENENVADLYSTHITESYIVNSKGEKVDNGKDPFDVNVSFLCSCATRATAQNTLCRYMEPDFGDRYGAT